MSLNDDIFNLILEKTNNIKFVVGLEVLSKHYKKIIRYYGWHIQVNIRNDIVFERIVNNYNFKNLKISSRCDINLFINKLKNCHTLDLQNTNITDESVKLLGNCHTLNLSYTNITDESVKLLGNCHTLYLFFCIKITDESVKLLGNCHTLDLFNTKITNESVKLLKSYGCIVHK